MPHNAAPTHVNVPYETGSFTRVPQDTQDKAMFDLLIKMGMVFVKGVKPNKFRTQITSGFPVKGYVIYFFCEKRFGKDQYIVKPVIFLDVVPNSDGLISFYEIDTDSRNKRRALGGRVRNTFTNELGNSFYQAVENKF